MGYVAWLKGTMSEAELHILRARLHQGKLNKARRGELFTCVPIGYVRSAEHGIALDPDEQVRSVVALIFAKYAELGSLTKVHAYLVANNIELGIRVYKGPGKGRLVWKRPRRSSLYTMLNHPYYAGAYVYGRAPLDPRRRLPNKPKSGRYNAPREEWILLQDKVPAYISWTQYEENRRRLQANDRGPGTKRRRVALRLCSTESCVAVVVVSRCSLAVLEFQRTRVMRAIPSSRSMVAHAVKVWSPRIPID